MSTTTIADSNRLSSNRLSGIDVTSVGAGPRSLTIAGISILAVSLALVLFTASDIARLLHAYLLSVCFFLSIGLGAIFFVILQHLTNARWSVVTRRVAELIASTIPAAGLLMVPIIVSMLFGNSQLYEWNDPQVRASDELIRGKALYLNAPFFAVRCVIYFGVWTLLSRFFLINSMRQDDSHDFSFSSKMRRFSGPSMLAFALTTNFAAFDWLMSLDPHWFSTIFGIYFFAGCVVAFLAVLPIVFTILQRSGYVAHAVTDEHFHDMGKLLFGFMMFWAYIAFSQYLLIWYANIPEETGWFLVRQNGGWQFISLLLIVGHFALPFFGLMTRTARRDRKTLAIWSAFLLVMHWFDLFWLIMPNVSVDSVPLGIIELLCFAGIGTLWLAFLLRNMAGKRLVPKGDPHISESLAFHNT